MSLAARIQNLSDDDDPFSLLDRRILLPTYQFTEGNSFFSLTWYNNFGFKLANDTIQHNLNLVIHKCQWCSNQWLSAIPVNLAYLLLIFKTFRYKSFLLLLLATGPLGPPLAFLLIYGLSALYRYRTCHRPRSDLGWLRIQNADKTIAPGKPWWRSKNYKFILMIAISYIDRFRHKSRTKSGSELRWCNKYFSPDWVLASITKMNYQANIPLLCREFKHIFTTRNIHAHVSLG